MGSDAAAGLAFVLALALANLKASFFLPETEIAIHDNLQSMFRQPNVLLRFHVLMLSSGNLGRQISRKQ